jgi:hypothetical protein
MFDIRSIVEDFLDKHEKEGLRDYQKRNLDAINRSVSKNQLELKDAAKKVVLELRKESVWLSDSEIKELEDELGL